jgi:biopolymer transport protein ExbD
MALSASDTQPMGEMNTTPLIDVMLVLLIMFIMVIPAATHSVELDLPAPCTDCPLPNLEPTRNKIVIDASSRTLATIKASGVTKFGFVGNERYRQF